MKKYFVALLFSVVFLLHYTGICFAVDLDAPVEKKITIRSEVQRGLGALSRCGEKTKAIIKGVQYLS